MKNGELPKHPRASIKNRVGWFSMQQWHCGVIAPQTTSDHEPLTTRRTLKTNEKRHIRSHTELSNKHPQSISGRPSSSLSPHSNYVIIENLSIPPPAPNMLEEPPNLPLPHTYGICRSPIVVYRLDPCKHRPHTRHINWARLERANSTLINCCNAIVVCGYFRTLEEGD